MAVGEQVNRETEFFAALQNAGGDSCAADNPEGKNFVTGSLQQDVFIGVGDEEVIIFKSDALPLCGKGNDDVFFGEVGKA